MLGRRRHLAVSDGAHGAVVELSRNSVTPALGIAGVEEAPGMLQAANARDDGAANADVSGGFGILVVTDVAGVAIAELAIECVTPTAYSAIVENDAGMRATSIELDDVSPYSDVTGGCGRLIVTDVSDVAIAEPAKLS